MTLSLKRILEKPIFLLLALGIVALAEDLRRMGWDRVEIVSLRQGGVIGEHSVHLAGPDEELVLVHRALSRSVFARGALLAARFAAAAPPGRYGMDDVLAASE